MACLLNGWSGAITRELKEYSDGCCNLKGKRRRLICRREGLGRCEALPDARHWMSLWVLLVSLTSGTPGEVCAWWL
jgi:hypothetical protein